MPRLVRRPTFEDAIARLLTEAEATTDRAEKLDRLRRAAQMYDIQVGDGEKAFAVWQAAFAVDMRDERTAEALEALAQRLGTGPALVTDLWPLVASTSEPGQ